MLVVRALPRPGPFPPFSAVRKPSKLGGPRRGRRAPTTEERSSVTEARETEVERVVSTVQARRLPQEEPHDD